MFRDRAEAIAACQKNQGARKKIKAEGIDPLEEKGGEAFLTMLQALGEGNYYEGFNRLDIVFGDKVTVKSTGFQKADLILDSESTDPYLQIRNIQYDPANGLLVFSAPAYDTEVKDRMVYFGEYHFRLEISQSGGKVSMGGEILLDDHFNKVTRRGRAAFTGLMSEPEKQQDDQ